MAGIGFCLSRSAQAGSYARYIIQPESGVSGKIDYISVSAVAVAVANLYKPLTVKLMYVTTLGSSNTIIPITKKDSVIKQDISNVAIAYVSSTIFPDSFTVIDTRNIYLNGDEFLWFSLREHDDILITNEKFIMITLNFSTTGYYAINIEGSF